MINHGTIPWWGWVHGRCVPMKCSFHLSAAWWWETLALRFYLDKQSDSLHATCHESNRNIAEESEICPQGWAPTQPEKIFIPIDQNLDTFYTKHPIIFR